MPQKRDSQSQPGSLVEELVLALSDKRVVDAVASIIESKLQTIIQSVSDLREENKYLSSTVNQLEKELTSVKDKINTLENHDKQNNLIIVGLPLTSYAEASADSATQENIVSTEQAVMKLATETLKVPLQPTDISIARRVSSRVSTNTVPRVMVRFTNQKARNMVFAARSSLKVHARNTGVYQRGPGRSYC